MNKPKKLHPHKPHLLSLKSPHTLASILTFFPKTSLLKIVKKSKYLQKHLSISLSTYKIYSIILQNKSLFANPTISDSASDSEPNSNSIEDIYAKLSPLFPKNFYKEDLLNCIINFNYEIQQKSLIKLKGITLSEHTESVLCIIQLRNKNIASASLDKTIRIFTAKNYKYIGVLMGHLDDVSCIVQDAKYDNILYSGSDDRTIKVWDIEKYICLGTYTGHTDIIFSICLLNDNYDTPKDSVNKNRFLISCGEDFKINTWKIDYILPTLPEKYICNCDCMHCNNLIKGKKNNNLLNVKSILTLLSTLSDHNDSVTCLAPLNNSQFASGSTDAQIIIWENKNNDSFNIFKKLLGYSGGIYALSYMKRKNYLLSGGENGVIKIWSLDKYVCINTIPQAHSEDICNFCIDLFNEDYFFSSAADNCIIRWDVNTCKKEYVLEGHWKQVNSILMLDNGVLCSGSEDKTIKVWDLEKEDKCCDRVYGVEGYVSINPREVFVHKHVKIICE